MRKQCRCLQDTETTQRFAFMMMKGGAAKKIKVYPFGWSSGQEEVQVLSSEISKDVNAHRHRAWL